MECDFSCGAHGRVGDDKILYNKIKMQFCDCIIDIGAVWTAPICLCFFNQLHNSLNRIHLAAACHIFHINMSGSI